jgi:hypothetical protein
MGIPRSYLNMAGVGDPQIAVWTVSADIKLDALDQRKIVAEINGAGDRRMYAFQASYRRC